MTLQDIVREASHRAGVPFDDARRVVYTFLSGLTHECIYSHEPVTINNIGRLEPIKIPARSYVGFGGTEKWCPERYTVRLRAKSVEVSTWKNTESTLSTAVPALFVAREQFLKDKLPYVLSTALLLSKESKSLEKKEKLNLLKTLLSLLGIPKSDKKSTGFLVEYRLYGKTTYVLVDDGPLQESLDQCRNLLGYVPRNLMIWTPNGVYVHRIKSIVRNSYSELPSDLTDIFNLILYSKYENPTPLRFNQYEKVQ